MVLTCLADVKDLSLLPRRPSDLANYIIWVHRTRARYGSVATYIIQERLHWQLPAHESDADQCISQKDSSQRSDVPFVQPESYRVLRNDWPYGLTEDIAHLVVWSKVWIPTDADGRPTTEAAKDIHNFVEGTFRSRLEPDTVHSGDCVVWFKNDTRWQSVKALEHIHIFVRGASESLLDEWTGQRATDITARRYRSEETIYAAED